MEAICSSKPSVETRRTTWRHIPEDDTLHNHRCENLKSYTAIVSVCHNLWQTKTVLRLLDFHAVNIQHIYLVWLKIIPLYWAIISFWSNFEVYHGEQKEAPFLVSNFKSGIVKRLICHSEVLNRNLSANNLYNTYLLAKYVLKKKITYLGIMKKNKWDIPLESLKELSSRILKSGFQEDTLVSYVRKRNKSVLL
jgi:hypothetical protein